MAIIVVLAAVAIPTFGRQLETARETADMEVIRAAYTEALTVAMLDSQDGDLDGITSNADGATAGTYTAVAYAANGTDGTKGDYTVTLASLDSKPTFVQAKADWQYVSKYVLGTTAPTDVTSKTTGVKFTFELDGTSNSLKLTAIAAVNPSTSTP